MGFPELQSLITAESGRVFAGRLKVETSFSIASWTLIRCRLIGGLLGVSFTSRVFEDQGSKPETILNLKIGT